MGSIPGQEDPLEKKMATHCSILAYKIQWIEEPGGLQSTGSQKSQSRLSDRQQQILKNVNVNLLRGLKIKAVKLGEKDKHILFKRNTSKDEDMEVLKEKR